MDPFSTTVIGSRHPICVPVAKRSSQTPKPHIPTPPALPYPRTSSTIRRKPLRTYKSPSAYDIVGLRIEGEVKHRQPSTASQSPSSETIHPKPHKRQRLDDWMRISAPSLSLYHPHGLLALSLPELDPGLFGLPNPVSIDDNDLALDDADSLRRASSRARRPAAKVRDRDRDDGEESTPVNGTSSGVNGQEVRSPKKRRTAGGTGVRRRRKEVEDGDGTYPQPARRTRNPRGSAAVPASPLAGVAVVATDIERDADIPTLHDVPDTADIVADIAQPTRSTRSRRPRNPPSKRRGSSASETTSTSVSISIAANAKITRAARNKTDDIAGHDIEPDQQSSVQKKEEEEPEHDEEPHDKTEEVVSQVENEAPPVTREIVEVVVTKDVEMKDVLKAPSVVLDEPQNVTVPQPPKDETPAQQKEEKEEGELSEDT